MSDTESNYTDLDTDLDTEVDTELDTDLNTELDTELDTEDITNNDIEKIYGFENDISMLQPKPIPFNNQKIIIVNNKDRITSNKISHYEQTELISIRSEQISKNGFTFYKSDVKLDNPINMAIQEMNENRCPLMIRRHIGRNFYEDWDPNTMIKPILPYR